MNIVYAPGDNYAAYTGVSIYSLCSCNREAGEINIYIISNDISEENKKRLISVAESFGRNIYFTEAAAELESFGREIDAGSYGINVFGRFFMGRLLPESIDRLLYLDCDTVVDGSLEELFRLPFGDGCPVAYAVPEPTIYKSVLRSLGFAEDEVYFNAGVIFIDFKRWREERISDRLIDFYKKNGGRLACADQDALNFVLKDELGAMPPKFNFFTNYRYYSYRYLCAQSRSYGRLVSRDEFREAVKRPAVIHYLGAERPWLRGNLNPYRDRYERYLSLTPFKGMKKIRGSEASLLLFHLMELLTLICPAARSLISRAYERKNIESRAKPAD